jgi:hypothetical protein
VSETFAAPAKVRFSAAAFTGEVKAALHFQQGGLRVS